MNFDFEFIGRNYTRKSPLINAYFYLTNGLVKTLPIDEKSINNEKS